ncbi:MAG: hypothetical protein KZQ93_05595 [Candidatus Thiodiazotropha sp. (ex Monitilora ramsayi)]|nr:hypothetical protein [Candidatus Thiodiazotropha sp. (ex Monitilora ramsayi)]
MREREEFDDEGNRNPPDLTRLTDSVLDPQLVDQGLLKSISKEDLEDSDIYVFREATGQLVNSTKGWLDKGGDNFVGISGGVVDGSDWQGFYYSTTVASPAQSLFVDDLIYRPWEASTVGDGLPTEPPDYLRIGEVVRVVAINRKTGYIGTTKFRMTSLDIDFDPARNMTLRPPNLKVIATRTYKDEAGLTQGEQHNNQLIGSEGAGLSSDTYIKIQTIWLDHDGSPLPEGLEGYTGRLAVSTGSSTRDFSGNFEISPGYQTQVVQLNNSADLTTEHFYVQVVGEFINDNPTFANPGAGPGKLQTRPKYYVPIKVPVYNELATLDAQNALAQARRDGVEGLPESVDPVYHWVYRPEMQFSVYDFKVNQIRQEIAADEFVDIYPAGADDDPGSFPCWVAAMTSPKYFMN